MDAVASASYGTVDKHCTCTRPAFTGFGEESGNSRRSHPYGTFTRIGRRPVALTLPPNHLYARGEPKDVEAM
jgi:hypothetical protein